MNSAKIDPLDAELLLANVLHKPREWVLANPEARVNKVYKVRKFIKLVRQRERGVPIAYLTGHKEFFGLDFEVNKNVLIPRPDTEVLVEAVVSQLSTYPDKVRDPVFHRDNLQLNTCLIDVGTGSGCIPISIAHNIHNSGLSVIRNVFAIDISKQALSIAKRNAKKHHVKIKFIQSDLLTPVIARRPLPTKQSNCKSSISNLQSSIIITANLPYLTNKQFKSSPSIQYEPKLALVAKDNGLALYKKLLKQIRKLTTCPANGIPSWQRDGLRLTAFMEIDPSQSSRLTKLISLILPSAKIEIKKDLSGLERMVIISVNWRSQN